MVMMQMEWKYNFNGMETELKLEPVLKLEFE